MRQNRHLPEPLQHYFAKQWITRRQGEAGQAFLNLVADADREAMAQANRDGLRRVSNGGAMAAVESIATARQKLSAARGALGWALEKYAFGVCVHGHHARAVDPKVTPKQAMAHLRLALETLDHFFSMRG